MRRGQLPLRTVLPAAECMLSRPAGACVTTAVATYPAGIAWASSSTLASPFSSQVSAVGTAIDAPGASSGSAGGWHAAWSAVGVAAAALSGVFAALQYSEQDANASGVQHWRTQHRLFGLLPMSVSICEQQQQQQEQVVPASGAASREQAIAELTQWLRDRGADLSRVEIRASQAGPDAGLGLFLRPEAAAKASARRWSWWWPPSWLQSLNGGSGGGSMATLATFPLSSAITVNSVLEGADMKSAKLYGWLLGQEIFDERTLIMTFLMVERARGEGSPLAPWIRSLPTSFDTPLYSTREELALLRGTTLHKAAEAVLQRLREQWRTMEPGVRDAAKEFGLPRQMGFEDLLWAHHVFWSRGQSLPVPDHGPAHKALARGPGAITVLEGIVPGLDLCNHSNAANCWWEVVAPGSAKNGGNKQRIGSVPDADKTVLTLHPHSGAVFSAACRGKRGGRHGHGSGSGEDGVNPQELMISYGDKSNEELLLLYGFALHPNKYDYVMVALPLPHPSQWDDDMPARVELLKASGLSRQFFFKGDATAAPAADSPAKPRQRHHHRKRSGAPAEDEDEGVAFPPEVLQSLEVFVLNRDELRRQLNARRVDREDAAGPLPGGSAQLAAAAWASTAMDAATAAAKLSQQGSQLTASELAAMRHNLGLRMATLTTLSKLLEVKVVDLEGPETGTGSLEADMASLADPSGLPPSPGVSPHRARAAVAYRAGQKRIARQWLLRTRQELTRVMAVLADLDERIVAAGAAASARAGAKA